MNDLKSLQAIYETAEGNIVRLTVVRNEVESLDATGIEPSVRLLHALLKDPAKVDEAEGRIKAIKEAVTGKTTYSGGGGVSEDGGFHRPRDPDTRSASKRVRVSRIRKPSS